MSEKERNRGKWGEGWGEVGKREKGGENVGVGGKLSTGEYEEV